MILRKEDYALLNVLQADCKKSLKKLSKELKMPMSTIYDKIKRFEDAGIIQHYSAVLDFEKLGKTTTSFILVTVRHHFPNLSEPISQRNIAKEIAKLPLVQEVHIINGEWDILLKVKGSSVKEIGNWVIDRLRGIRGVDRTLTIDSVVVEKESLEIPLV